MSKSRDRKDAVRRLGPIVTDHGFEILIEALAEIASSFERDHEIDRDLNGAGNSADAKTLKQFTIKIRRLILTARNMDAVDWM